MHASKSKSSEKKFYELLFLSMTPLISNKVHLLTGWRDIPKGKPWEFYFLKKVTYSFLDDAKKAKI